MKKLNKFIAILVALAMMAVLGISAAFAEDEEPTPAEPTTAATVPTGDEDSAKLVKYLQAGEGITVPAGTIFNFTVTNTANANDVINVQIPFSGMTEDVNHDYIGEKTIAQIFANYTFPAAGEYTFTVAEAAATVTLATGEELTINDLNDTYTLHIYVKNGDNGTEIDKVTVSDGTEKVDPKEKEPTADEGEGKGFSFTNTFTKDLTDTNDQDNSGLIDLTKTVTGDYGDKTYKFPFELTYTLPDDNDGPVKYKVLKDGTTEAAAQEQTASNGKIEVTLGHGDKLIITAAPQGLKWATEEKIASATDLQNYDKYTTKANGQDGTTTAQAVLTTTGAAAYVNDLDTDEITPEGILINNLPYIALALVAIGGLVAYVVIRRRNADEA